MTIPEIGTFFAVLIAQEIDDVNRFRTDRTLHNYLGLVPCTPAGDFAGNRAPAPHLSHLLRNVLAGRYL